MVSIWGNLIVLSYTFIFVASGHDSCSFIQKSALVERIDAELDKDKSFQSGKPDDKSYQPDKQIEVDEATKHKDGKDGKDDKKNGEKNVKEDKEHKDYKGYKDWKDYKDHKSDKDGKDAKEGYLLIGADAEPPQPGKVVSRGVPNVAWENIDAFTIALNLQFQQNPAEVELTSIFQLQDPFVLKIAPSKLSVWLTADNSLRVSTFATGRSANEKTFFTRVFPTETWISLLLSVSASERKVTVSHAYGEERGMMEYQLWSEETPLEEIVLNDRSFWEVYYCHRDEDRLFFDPFSGTVRNMKFYPRLLSPKEMDDYHDAGEKSLRGALAPDFTEDAYMLIGAEAQDPVPGTILSHHILNAVWENTADFTFALNLKLNNDDASGSIFTFQKPLEPDETETQPSKLGLLMDVDQLALGPFRTSSAASETLQTVTHLPSNLWISVVLSVSGTEQRVEISFDIDGVRHDEEVILNMIDLGSRSFWEVYYSMPDSETAFNGQAKYMMYYPRLLHPDEIDAYHASTSGSSDEKKVNKILDPRSQRAYRSNEDGYALIGAEPLSPRIGQRLSRNIPNWVWENSAEFSVALTLKLNEASSAEVTSIFALQEPDEEKRRPAKLSVYLSEDNRLTISPFASRSNRNKNLFTATKQIPAARWVSVVLSVSAWDKVVTISYGDGEERVEQEQQLENVEVELNHRSFWEIYYGHPEYKKDTPPSFNGMAKYMRYFPRLLSPHEIQAYHTMAGKP
mmetsp:Transcript_26060/g.57468  ORF Transcript_26060/g.57468 Transcript_26060/m.57468 type:complete len:739 (-) Transcript_26060:16-2232(-)